MTSSTFQEVANRLARLSINALACMAGFLTKDGENTMMTSTLKALITPYLTRQLASGGYAEVNCDWSQGLSSNFFFNF